MQLLGKSILTCVLLASGGSVLGAEPIDECGLLGESYPPPGCVIFRSFETGEEYATDLPEFPDSLEFTPIRIQGTVIGYCQPDCSPYLWNCIADAVILECEPIDLGCGVLHEDVYDFCHTWTSSVHGRLLGPLMGHADGDTVQATGIIDRYGESTCMFGEGFRWEATYVDCPDSLTAIDEMTWGRIKTTYR